MLKISLFGDHLVRRRSAKYADSAPRSQSQKPGGWGQQELQVLPNSPGACVWVRLRPLCPGAGHSAV